MKFISSDIVRIRQRTFQEKGAFLIEKGDEVISLTGAKYRALEEKEVRAKRRVRKNGKVMGPWISKTPVSGIPDAFYINEL